MHVTFDEAKDGLNQIKHGVALSESAVAKADVYCGYHAE